MLNITLLHGLTLNMHLLQKLYRAPSSPFCLLPPKKHKEHNLNNVKKPWQRSLSPLDRACMAFGAPTVKAKSPSSTSSPTHWLQNRVKCSGCSKPARGITFRRILGYMPQQQGLYDSYTGRRFLAYMAALKEISRKAVAAEVDRVAAAVNLTAELDKHLSAYSGGMKQRLLLASALLGDPKLLILDEPTAGLDPKERVRLRELLADMAKDRIILVATHVVSDVETVATKVILLRAGKIVDAAPVPELIEKYAPGQGLEDVYLNVFGEGDGK